jgi:hypothetical protein
LTHVSLLVSLVTLVEAASAAVAVVVAVVVWRAAYEAMLAAVLFACGVAIISSLGDDDFDMAVLAFDASVLDAIITAFTAAIFAFDLDAFSRHFFLWLRLPCPGPGMLGVRTE